MIPIVSPYETNHIKRAYREFVSALTKDLFNFKESDSLEQLVEECVEDESNVRLVLFCSENLNAIENYGSNVTDCNPEEALKRIALYALQHDMTENLKRKGRKSDG